MLLQVWLENVFFRTLPIVLSLAAGTMFNSTTFSSSNCNVHRARPLGGSEQARAINFASAAPSNIRGLAEFGECLRVNTASNPSSTSRRRVRATVSVLVSSARAISQSLHPPPHGDVSAFNRIRALSNCDAERFPTRIKVKRCSRSSSLSVTIYFLLIFYFAAIKQPSPLSGEGHRIKF